MTVAPNTYDQGTRVRLTATFRDDTAALTSPAVVECKVGEPDGTVVTLSASNVSLGVFEAFVTPDAPGEWWVRWAGTSGLVVASERRFLVRARKVA